QFVRSSPDYETILTPRDFERAEQLGNPPHYNKYDTDDPDAMYKKDLFEGDIANENASFSCFPQFLELNSSTVEMFLNGGAGDAHRGWYNAIKNRHQLWPNGRIPYTISSQYSSYSRSQIAASMQEYSLHTCIKWVPKTNNDVNYVYIFPDRGCYSMMEANLKVRRAAATTTTTAETWTTTAEVLPPVTTTLPPVTTPPVLTPLTLPPPVVSECKNLRGDCDKLRDNGPGVTLPPIVPTSPPGDCDDLRVDCLVLVSQRYCKISESFMKKYCAKSCGFCFKPPPTEPSRTNWDYIIYNI
ncbi:shTK domain protein, partial [Teladorsagia circumcincta]